MAPSRDRERVCGRRDGVDAVARVHSRDRDPQALEKELAQKVRPVLQSVGCPTPAIDRAVPKLLRNWPQILEA